MHDKVVGIAATTNPVVMTNVASASADVAEAAGEVTIVKLGATSAFPQQNETIPTFSPETPQYTLPWSEVQPIKHHAIFIRHTQIIADVDGEAARAYTAAATVVATTNVTDGPNNAANSTASYTADATTSCSTAAVIVPTPPHDADRKWTENTEREAADQKGEADL